MYLKRFYKNAAALQAMHPELRRGAAELDYISLGHTGATPDQHFSTDFVLEMLTAGLMELRDGELFFKVYPEHLRYTILRTPGTYCLHCGAKLPSDPKGEEARAHIAAAHDDIQSPSANYPAGYEVTHYYDCVLNAEQHAKYKRKPGDVTTHFPVKES